MSGELAKEFHKKTFKTATGTHAVSAENIIGIEFKEYPRMKSTPLLSDVDFKADLLETLRRRQSSQNFSEEVSISFEELSKLLVFGVKMRGKLDAYGNPTDPKRFYPSGGGRFPLETYLIIKKLTGVDPGLYHYNALRHTLEKLLEIKDVKNLPGALTQPWSQNAPVLLFVTAVWERTMPKYGDLGYQLTLMEVGHLAQNILLLSTALHIPSRPSVGFIKEEIEKILDIHHDDSESAVYMIALGR